MRGADYKAHSLCLFIEFWMAEKTAHKYSDFIFLDGQTNQAVSRMT